MKRMIYVCSLLLLFVVIGCEKKYDVASGERPEERMKAALDELRSNILDAPHGWKGELVTAADNGFSFYFDFDDKDRVVMVSDIDEETSSVPFESGYRLRAVMAASLLFDTYSYIHLLADPNPGVAGGTVARGYSSDFEFEYNGVSGDSLMMIGKKRRSHFRMIPATAEEKGAYLNGEFKDRIDDFNTFIESTNPYFLLSGSDIKYSISFSDRTKKATVLWLEGGVVSSIDAPYYYTLTGAHFPKGISIEGTTFTHLNMTSPSAGKIITNDGTEYDVIDNGVPVIPLWMQIGVAYSSITIPDVNEFAGWGNDFIAARAQADAPTAVRRWNVGGVNLRVGAMTLIFNSNNEQAIFRINTPYGASSLNLDYPYTYTMEDGVFKFTANAPSGNAASIYNDVRTLVDRISEDHFEIEWYKDPVSGNLYGKFGSIENPAFVFTGNMN